MLLATPLAGGSAASVLRHNGHVTPRIASAARGADPGSAVQVLRVPVGLGLLAVLVLVVASGRASTPLGMRLPASFGGLLRPSTGGGTVAAATVVLALACLIACWWAVLRATQRFHLSMRAIGWTVGLWTVPVLAGPPLLSMDAYAYLAQGNMMVAGLDPYGGGPVLLGDEAAMRMDPMWRASPVPYGPMTLVLLRAVALVPGDLTTGVLLLRGLALLGVVAAVAMALRLARPGRAPYVLAVTALNPITLIHLVGGAHVDGVLAGVVALCLLALHSGRVRAGWLLAGTAVAIKVTVAPLLAFAGVALLRRPWRARALLPAAALAAAPYLLTLGVLRRPWGFLPALAVPGEASPWYAPATVAGQLLRAVAWLAGLPLSDGLLAAVGRFLVLAAGAAVVLALLRADVRDTGPGRPRRTVRRICVALLVVPLALPSLYGWYLAPALFGLAAVGTRRQLPVLVALSSALTFTSLPPMYGVDRRVVAAVWVVALVVLAVSARQPERSLLGSLRLVEPGRAPGTGTRHWGRLAQLAGLVLLVPVAVGLLTPGAAAKPAEAQAVDTAAVNQRRAVVDQLRTDYPQLHIVAVSPPLEDGLVWVSLVEPGHRTCDLQLRRGIGPQARYLRLPDVIEPLSVGELARQACPPPWSPAAAPPP